MTNQNDLSELKTFADWCRVIDRLPAEAKRTVEVLVELVDWGYVWSWIPDAAKTALECEVRERTFSACTELGLGEYYDEFPLKDLWSLVPDEVRIAIKERILLACKKLSFRQLQLPVWGDSSYQLTDLRPLASFAQLTSLDLNGVFDIDFGKSRSYGKLSDISIIANFTHLTELDLSHNMITDLSPLAALTELKVLDLSDNLITDLSPLSTLTELKVLDLSDNPITDLSPLSTLKNLTGLELSGTRLTEQTDFSPLLALTQLQSLDLSRNWIGDRSVETIARLTTLKNLDVSYNRITDISPLTTLPNLIRLDSSCAWDIGKG